MHTVTTREKRIRNVLHGCSYLSMLDLFLGFSGATLIDDASCTEDMIPSHRHLQVL